MMDFFEWDDLMRDLVIVLAIIVVVYISYNITPVTIETVASGQVTTDLVAFGQGKVSFVSIFSHYLAPLKNVLTVFSVFFLAGMFWSMLRGAEVHHKEHVLYAPLPLEEKKATEEMTRWQGVLDHVNSDNSAEWKIAILEADDMLDQILEEQGYFGETVAEKLKVMDPSRVVSYAGLWDAHKLRNQIAHGGAVDMELTKKLARDTVAKFENAFRDLGVLS